jgi:Lipase (class 3)
MQISMIHSAPSSIEPNAALDGDDSYDKKSCSLANFKPENLGILKEYARMARDAYCEVENTTDQLDAEKGITIAMKSKRTTVWLHAPKNSTIVTVAFRGTMGLYEWIRNSNISPQSIGDEAVVHHGFYNSYKDVETFFKNEIEKILNQREDVSQIVFTGHSAGGSIAAIAAYDFIPTLKEKTIPFSVVMFSAPRVGNKEFVETLESNACQVLLVRNEKDLVPYLPRKLRALSLAKKISTAIKNILGSKNSIKIQDFTAQLLVTPKTNVEGALSKFCSYYSDVTKNLSTPQCKVPALTSMFQLVPVEYENHMAFTSTDFFTYSQCGQNNKRYLEAEQDTFSTDATEVKSFFDGTA